MEYTEEQKNEFKAQFAKKRRNQRILRVPTIAAIISVTLGERHVGQALGVSREIIRGAAFVVVLGYLVFSLINWRCPACGKYLRRGLSPNHCPHCGVALRTQ